MSAYFDSTNKMEKLIDKAIELGLYGVAITDHEIVASHVKALQYMEKLRKQKPELESFKLVLGNEIYLVRNGLNKQNYNKEIDKFWHFILLAKDKEGHEQLRRLSSEAWKHSYKKFIERVPTYYSDIETVIGENKGHLIASTACLGSYFAKCIRDDEIEELNNFVKWCQEWFGEDFYIEIQPSKQMDQINYNKKAIKYAIKHNIKITVTTDSHYLTEKDRPIHKAFLNANEGEREVDAFYSATYMMSWEEICSFLYYVDTELLEKIRTNTIEIADKCSLYSLKHEQVVPKIPVPEYYLPGIVPPGSKYPIICKFFNSEYPDDNYFISKVTRKLFEISQGKTFEWYEKRLDRIELECEEIWLVSERLGERLSAYFTTMSRIIDIAWDTTETLVGPGRGSAYVMEVCYLLGITQADPLDSPIGLPHWRFLHREKIELPDIDTDFQSTKKDKLIEDITKFFEGIGGNVVRVATFGTETSKAAMQTACRGLGYEPEFGTYLSSLIPVDRGQVRSLKQTYYGDQEKDFSPINNFCTEMDDYPDIWEVAQNIEGLISRRGVHAAGILITNDDIVNRNALMKAPSGVLTSQFELHDSEYMGGLKYDLLVTDALDREAVALQLLLKNNYIEWKGSLRETYLHYLSPNVLEYDDPNMWDMVNTGKILSLFQFDSPVGSQAIRGIQPTSLLELGQANSLMRLMPEAGKESPIQEFIKYKTNINLFIDEVNSLNGTNKEKEVLKRHLMPLKGVADSQESLMLLVMDKDLTNFTVPEANFLRKTIAKKLTRDIDKLKNFLYEKGKTNGVSPDILDYIWNVQASRQMGYSFSLPHLMAYSTIAIQEMNLAYKFPIVFWNTANLIVDSAGIEEIENEDFDFEIEENGNGNEKEETLVDEDDTDSDSDFEVADGLLETTKKKVKTVNYGRISSAIGKMRLAGVKVELPDINNSNFTFTPVVKTNSILFGIKGITKINTDLAKTIIENRPYSSINDFLNKVKINKIPMINLIKSGAFDNIENKTREEILSNFILSVSDQKAKLTLANIPMLEKYKVIPNEFDFQRRVYNYNKDLKKHIVKETFYELEPRAFAFYETYFNMNDIIMSEGKTMLPIKTWTKTYDKTMLSLKEEMKKNSIILDNLNKALFNETMEKYAKGSISKWEMDSVNFYYHEHELNNIKFEDYNIKDFYSEDEVPTIAKTITIKKSIVPIYELWRICGTVIDKNKLKSTVTLSTPTGVVEVKIFKSQFAKYDKQISEKQADGKKKIVEKSWFSRGNLLMFTGIRRDNNFFPKVYKKGAYMYPIQIIENIDDNGRLLFKKMRGDD